MKIIKKIVEYTGLMMGAIGLSLMGAVVIVFLLSLLTFGRINFMGEDIFFFLSLLTWGMVLMGVGSKIYKEVKK